MWGALCAPQSRAGEPHLHLQVFETGDGIVVFGSCLLHLALPVQLVALFVDHRYSLQLLLIRHGPRVFCGAGTPIHPWAVVSTHLATGTEELRLVGGGGRCAGRVEVKHNGKWGSVCVYDFDWDARWATVVCRQLGCGRVAKASSYTPFGQGTGQIWLQPFFCRGTEAKLQDCPHFGWGKHFCGHKLDVGVTCTGELVGGDWSCRDTCPGCPWAGLMPCRCPGADAVELRLAAGEGPCSGRVEVKLQGQWGSVGDENWDMDNAEVVCQHLGCGSAARTYLANTRFISGDSVISLALVDCRGDEAALWDCEIRGWGPYEGVHDFDTAVECQGRRFARLAGGPGRCAGRVEVYINGTWGTVCQETWDMLDAAVVCRQLGCGTALAAPSSARFGPGTGPLWLDAGGCVGTEASLWDCPALARHDCQRGGGAGVVCSGQCHEP
uniref:SRCR domain-containing protein n=1 Tax=Athene cunicularia TaxID=194338 RepID=A0A663M0N6_ATHCN